MLTRTETGRGVELVEPALSCAHGVVLFLGSNREVLIHLAQQARVSKILAVSLDTDAIRDTKHKMILTTGEGAKIEVVERNPFRLKAKDIQFAQVDFLYADLWRDPWAIARTDELRDIARAIRPKRVGYPFQELDIAATWVSAGKCLDDLLTAEAIDIFRLDTSLTIEPRTDAYAERCQQLAKAYMGVGR